ncbi:MAG: biopolymer transporter ExbD, partial [Oligoflexia bacterium]|nr:biopolymer transporter ExbD [Oligoflexia bacterium]
MAFYREDDSDIDINVTPLIDVVFILLIFFMISTTFIATPGFKINLPKANAPSIKEQDKNITIAISREGIINFDGKITGIKELKSLILSKRKRI